MPITVNEIDSQIDVDTPGAGQMTGRAEPLAEKLQRWREAALRASALEERVSACDFDD